MKYLIMLSLLVGYTAHAEGAMSKCFQLMNGTSIMKFDHEYRLGYSVLIRVGTNPYATRQYFTKKFVDMNTAQFEEIDCEAFTWELK